MGKIFHTFGCRGRGSDPSVGFFLRVPLSSILLFLKTRQHGSLWDYLKVELEKDSEKLSQYPKVSWYKFNQISNIQRARVQGCQTKLQLYNTVFIIKNGIQVFGNYSVYIMMNQSSKSLFPSSVRHPKEWKTPPSYHNFRNKTC